MRLIKLSTKLLSLIYPLCVFYIVTHWTFKGDFALRFYPVIMNGFVCFIFTRSLFHDSTIVESFIKETLAARQKAYARNVTLAWSVFLGVNTLLSFVTVFLPIEIWTIYNGVVSYILMGIMFAGEYIIRKRKRI